MQIFPETLFIIEEQLETTSISISLKNYNILAEHNMVPALKSIMSVIYIHYLRSS